MKNKRIGYEHIKETDFFYKACFKALLLDLDYSVLLNLKKSIINYTSTSSFLQIRENEDY